MRVYVIGSCRVHGPLRGRPEYQAPIVGYTHTAKEAIQRIGFVRGSVKIPNSLARCIFARQRTPEVTRRHRAAFSGADVVVVEVCSSKDASHKGYAVNINYAPRFGVTPHIEDASRTLDEDIARLRDSVPRLVVAQHVELGIAARERFAAQLREVCGDLDVPVFDPAEVEPVMIDPYHYDAASIRRVGDRLMEVCRGRAG